MKSMHYAILDTFMPSVEGYENKHFKHTYLYPEQIV